MSHGTRTWLLSAVLALVACGGRAPSPATSAAADAAARSRQLNELVEGYFEETLKLNPVGATFIGDHRYDDRLSPPRPEYQKLSQALEQSSLDELSRVGRDGLDANDTITYDVFGYSRRMALEGFAWPDYLLPINQLDNPASYFAQMGSGETVQVFATVKDYENFAKRMDAFPAWVDQAIADLREGVTRGIVLPRVLAEQVVPQLDELAADTPEKSAFWKPIANMPASVPAPDRERLTQIYREAIRERVLPAYRRLRDFFRDEYLAKTRETIGYSALPDGDKWYAYRARAFTTTDTSVEEIHQLGLREVARLDGEVGKIMSRIGFRGDVASLAQSMRHNPRFFYKTPGELLDAYRGVESRVTAAVPRLFTLMPKSQMVVRPFESFRERAAPMAEYYSPAADGSRPAFFYVNTWDLPARPSYEIETIFLHEAIPGHHFQLSLAIENTGLPRFRRLSSDDVFNLAPRTDTAYVEGWALYAESLGDELGMYTDPYQKLGNLFADTWRAVRLVVDTGMHAKGWTRQQAIDYMLAHTALSKTDATAEVDRYIAWPGQALAYKVGQLTIRNLRSRAERELGPRFDVRAFHAQVLDDGVMPLAVLKDKIGHWIEAQR